ncbi:hypothetical protein [Sulfoacidibacillus ferrooxidans]|uniref:Uncharacterized protein n=1 Tax=Sulfoacidibacillus ferrooxidans TaxID=2005001 RepID=A0A9X2ADL0_9BACL|nr:hypothetical protein [Sulfoacidibacillus ferrooxidans]MCI0183550.1 hypothetical protein [Sulfoacidibacillus ferrooxidans]
MKSGELCQRVLWIVREFGPCGAPYVCDKVRDDHEISQNAVCISLEPANPIPILPVLVA